MKENIIEIKLDDQTFNSLNKAMNNSYLELNKFLELFLLDIAEKGFVPIEYDYNKNGKLLLNKELHKHKLSFQYMNSNLCIVKGSNVLFIKDFYINKYTSKYTIKGDSITFNKTLEYASNYNLKFYFAFIWNIEKDRRTVSIIDIDMFNTNNHTFIKKEIDDIRYDYIISFNDNDSLANINKAHEESIHNLVNSKIDESNIYTIYPRRKRF